MLFSRRHFTKTLKLYQVGGGETLKKSMQESNMIRLRKSISLPIIQMVFGEPSLQKDETEGNLEGEKRSNGSSQS